MLTVQLFASYAEAFGEPSLRISLESGATVADLVRSIRSLPQGRALPASPRVAINRKLADSNQLISKDDEIAVIPPVAGG